MANPASSAPRNLDSGETEPVAQTPSPPQHPKIDLTAFSDRDDFLLELGEALGGQASVHPVDTIDIALGQLTSNRRGQMLVIDARASADVRSDVLRAMQQAPHAVVVVFAEAASEKQVATAVKGTSVFAVLTVPLEGAKTTAVLDAAIADAVSRAPARTGAGGPAAPLTLDAFRPSMSYSPARELGESEGGGHKWVPWAGLGLIVVAIGAGGAWYFSRARPTSSLAPASISSGTVATHAGAAVQNAAPLAQPAVDTSIVAGHVDDLLEKARLAMRDRRYTAPTGDNAFVYYRSAAAADPTNGEAKDGLRRIGDVLVTRFTGAMQGSHYGDAALTLATLKLAQPSSPHLGPFQVQLSSAEIASAFTDGNVDRAAALLHQAQQSGAVSSNQLATWRAQLSRLQQTDKVQTLTALVLERVRSDELTSPTGNDAQTYLSQLREAAPSASATQRAANALINALLAKARQNALAGDSAGASHWLAAARTNGASSVELAEFQRQLASTQAKAEHAKTDHLIALVRARLGSGALTAPSGDDATDYLQQLENSHPSGAAQATAAQARGELAAKLIARARSEMRAGDSDQANSDLAAATNWGASAASVTAIQHLNSAPAAEPRPTQGPNLQTLAAHLQRTRYLAPQYPDRALDERIGGVVTVQYVVDTRGRTKDVQVIQSTPPGVFDRAAMDAIRGWRYRPVQYNGQPVEVPVRTLIRFELPN